MPSDSENITVSYLTIKPNLALIGEKGGNHNGTF